MPGTAAKSVSVPVLEEGLRASVEEVLADVQGEDFAARLVTVRGAREGTAEGDALAAKRTALMNLLGVRSFMELLTAAYLGRWPE